MAPNYFLLPYHKFCKKKTNLEEIVTIINEKKEALQYGKLLSVNADKIIFRN